MSIILDFIADPAGLQPATTALRELNKLSEESQATFTAANQQLQQTTPLLHQNVAAFSKLAGTIASMSLRDMMAEYSTWSKTANTQIADVAQHHATNEKSMTNTTRTEAQHRTLIEKQEAAKRILTLVSVKDTAIALARETTQAIFQSQAENRKRELDAALKQLEEKKTVELNNKTLTENQKQKIEERFRHSEAALKRQAWKADQEAKIGQVVINGILGASKAVAENPPPSPVGEIGAALAIASAAVQASQIAAQQPPAFAKGTKNAPRGMAWVGEQGPELMYLKGGEKIISHPDSVALLQKYEMPFAAPTVATAKTTHTSSFTIDYDRLASSISKHAERLSRVHVNIDKNGFSIYHQSQNLRSEIRNNRYNN